MRFSSILTRNTLNSHKTKDWWKIQWAKLPQGFFCSSPVDFYGVYLLQTSILSLHLLSLPDCNFSRVLLVQKWVWVADPDRCPWGGDAGSPEKCLFLIWNCWSDSLHKEAGVMCFIFFIIFFVSVYALELSLGGLSLVYSVGSF